MISVIIPAFSPPREWLEEALRALAGQSHGDWEAIIVDDCSPRAIQASEYSSILDADRLRVLRLNRNSGPGAARNAGVAQARGDYLYMHDADDWIEADTLGALARVLDEAPELDCVYSDFSLFGAQTTRWGSPVKDAAAMVRDAWIPGPGTMMRRALFDHVGGYCEDPLFRLGNEDWDFWLGAAERGVRAWRVEEAFYHYRVSPGSLSNGTTKKQHFRTLELLYSRHQGLIDGEGLKKAFFYDGYFSSIRKCDWSDLPVVLRGGLRYASSFGEGLLLLRAAIKKTAKALTGPRLWMALRKRISDEA